MNSNDKPPTCKKVIIEIGLIVLFAFGPLLVLYFVLRPLDVMTLVLPVRGSFPESVESSNKKEFARLYGYKFNEDIVDLERNILSEKASVSIGSEVADNLFGFPISYFNYYEVCFKNNFSYIDIYQDESKIIHSTTTFSYGNEIVEVYSGNKICKPLKKEKLLVSITRTYPDIRSTSTINFSQENTYIDASIYIRPRPSFSVVFAKLVFATLFWFELLFLINKTWDKLKDFHIWKYISNMFKKNKF